MPALPYRSVVVTGADGFVGRAFVAALDARLAADARLVRCGRAMTGGRGEHYPVDVTDPQPVRDLVGAVRPDLVVHLAARSSVAQSAHSVPATWRVNLDGTLNLAEAVAAAVPACTVLFVSTAEVYGHSFNDGVVDEDSALRPASPYARSKTAAEMGIADILTDDNRLIVVRPANHSGPGQDDRFVLPSFARQIARIERGLQAPVMQVGNLAPERDFLDVRDVINAYLAILTDPDHALRVTYNIARGRTVSIAALLEMMIAAATCPIAVEHDPERMRSAEIARTAIDTHRLHGAIAWQPRHDLETIVGDVLEAQRHLVAQTRAERA